MNIYRSIYRKKQYQDILYVLPLLTLYNEQYYEGNIGDVDVEHEMMFYLQIIRENKINFEDLYILRKYYTKKYDSIETLLKCGVDVNMRNNYGNTMLIQTSFCGCLEIIRAALRELISARCKLDIQNKNGDTALINAAYWKRMSRNSSRSATRTD